MREHLTGPGCWCNPSLEVLDELSGAKCWIHKESELTNPFQDVADFMSACGQTTLERNDLQSDLYRELISEEYSEWRTSWPGSIDDIDAVIDLIVVLTGYGLSRGWDMDAAWTEVHRTNVAKVDPLTGLVRKRIDGKILKPEGWTPPNLGPAMRGSA